MDTEKLVKVHIDLPNHWAINGEALWATPLGDDLYWIENVPFYAYGLNYSDIVHATQDSSDLKPEIRKVETPSGHRTYRVIFKKEVERENQIQLLNTLTQHGATFERADGTYVAIDIKPNGDHLSVYSQLDKYAEDGYLPSPVIRSL